MALSIVIAMLCFDNMSFVCNSCDFRTKVRLETDEGGFSPLVFRLCCDSRQLGQVKTCVLE